MNEERTEFFVKKSEIEIRSEGDSKGTITGFIPYDSLSLNLGGFREVIKKGCFSKTIKEGDIRALNNHDVKEVLGRTKSKTLTFRDEEDGLHFEINPPDTSYANDLMQSVSRSDVDGVSFLFSCIKDAWNYETTPVTRELLEVKLYEVSIVTFPAYPESKSSLRDAFSAAGIDYEKLAEEIRSAVNKKTDFKSNYISEAIEKLKNLIEEESEEKRAAKEHSFSDNSKPTQVTLKKMSLDLLEKSFI